MVFGFGDVPVRVEHEAISLIVIAPCSIRSDFVGTVAVEKTYTCPQVNDGVGSGVKIFDRDRVIVFKEVLQLPSPELSKRFRPGWSDVVLVPMSLGSISRVDANRCAWHPCGAIVHIRCILL